MIERKFSTEGVDDLYNMDEIKWRQKSRVKDVKQGDKNTSYFHIERKEGGSLSPGEVIERKFSRERVDDLYNTEEIKWRQKSRVKDAKQGDKNTSDFHRVTNVRKRSTLSKLMIDGALLDIEDAITRHAADFYKHLYV